MGGSAAAAAGITANLALWVVLITEDLAAAAVTVAAADPTPVSEGEAVLTTPAQTSRTAQVSVPAMVW